MPVEVQVEGLDKIKRRFRRFPQEYNQAIRKTLYFALGALWENVPPYPEQPESSTYKRTGTLGRTLGADMGGGKMSMQPEIYEVKKMGPQDMGEFGTNLNYAPYAIGETEQSEHMSHWWTIKTIADSAKQKIINGFKAMAEELANFLEGRL